MTREEKESELKRLARKQKRIRKKIDKFFADIEADKEGIRVKGNPFLVAAMVVNMIIDASYIRTEILSLQAQITDRDPIIIPHVPPEQRERREFQ